MCVYDMMCSFIEVGIASGKGHYMHFNEMENNASLVRIITILCIFPYLALQN